MISFTSHKCLAMEGLNMLVILLAFYATNFCKATTEVTLTTHLGTITGLSEQFGNKGVHKFLGEPHRFK